MAKAPTLRTKVFILIVVLVVSQLAVFIHVVKNEQSNRLREAKYKLSRRSDTLSQGVPEERFRWIEFWKKDFDVFGSRTRAKLSDQDTDQEQLPSIRPGLQRDGPPIPIVYTYTELSQSKGKYLLKASILSARNHMPKKAPIHIIYHGEEDRAFRSWLVSKGLIMHQHNPTWREEIETLRKKTGNSNSSHLYSHSGNHFGTWQRIDIPLLIESDYVLLLDSDTIVLKPLVSDDFRLESPFGIAMSSEMIPDDEPRNAGVLLMNVTRMRETYDDFLRFIVLHAEKGSNFPDGPVDQGAYLEFYGKENDDIGFLPRHFNFKPYWNISNIDVPEPFIVHFHGAKPHDYLKHFLGDSCDAAMQFMCESSLNYQMLCSAIQQFAKAMRSADYFAYCNANFNKDRAKVSFCMEVLTVLALEQEECFDLRYMIRQAMMRVPSDIGLAKDEIEKILSIGEPRFRPPMLVLVIVVLALYVTCTKWHQHSPRSWTGSFLPLPPVSSRNKHRD